MRPLDKQRAAALGCSTEPYEALACAVEALEVSTDPEAVAALEAVIEYILDEENTPPPKEEKVSWVSETKQAFPRLSATSIKKEALKDSRKHLLDVLSKEGPMTRTNLALQHAEKDLDQALWSLVQDGLVEHTLETPIHFRVRVRAKGKKTHCGV